MKAMPTGRIALSGWRSRAEADQWLEQRSGELEDEGDDADLEEAQRQLPREHRIERRRQRLHRVVEHVRGAERGDDADRGRFGGPPLSGGVSHRQALWSRFGTFRATIEQAIARNNPGREKRPE